MNIIISVCFHPSLEVNMFSLQGHFRFVYFLKLIFLGNKLHLGFEVTLAVTQATCCLTNAALPPSEMFFVDVSLS